MPNRQVACGGHHKPAVEGSIVVSPEGWRGGICPDCGAKVTVGRGALENLCFAHLRNEV